jgi:hypothetical protein
MSGFGVFLLRTSSAALRAEALLTRAALEVRLVPVPRELSTACGVAVRFPWAQRDRAHDVLRTAGLEVAAIHRLGAGAG